jgi:hypothetical protein
VIGQHSSHLHQNLRKGRATGFDCPIGLDHLHTQADILAQVCLLARLLATLMIAHWSATLLTLFARKAAKQRFTHQTHHTASST